MRLLGPRSISSLLKTAIDVVYFGIITLVIVVVLAIVALLSVPNLATQVVSELHLSAALDHVPGAGSQALMLLALGLSLGGYLLIMPLADGNVFHPENTRRLRLIGMGLAGIEVFSYGARLMAQGLFSINFETVYGLRAVTTWFSVLVVFVLAEVFREGARLQRDADLTI
jgi:hypothetical protein